MMLLALALAHAAPCDVPAAIAALPDGGRRDDYECVMEAEEGRDQLVAALIQAPVGKTERLTRALALWLLRRTDRPMDPALVERLSPADRRFLADGIHARRGRASPAVDHARIFEQFSWYEPDPTYTDARLRPSDRENLDVVDPSVRLVPAPVAPPDADAEVPAGVGDAVTAETPNLCGCAGVGGAGAAPMGVLAALLALVGRRRP